ncbi:MAG: MerR family transcriptional regulator [Chloroflexales bacterium]|nr:MerR family transcriptional regulator [Chloroflexales bacterium]
MIKIGDFSRMCRVPVSALRYYADLGLLPPAYVDPSTGYRYYSVAQLPRLHRILALRDLGLSLEQIGSVLRDNLPAEQIRGMLRLRQAELRQQIEEERARLARVEARLYQIEQEGTMSSYDVVVKAVEPQLVAAIRTIIPTYSAAGTLFEELYAYLGQHGSGGLPAIQDHNDEYKERDPDVEAMVYLAAPVPAGGRIKVYTLPGATVASTMHRGPYEQMGQAYAALMAWIQANGYRIAAPSRELYLQMGETPDGHVTEIQFPVLKA